ncbi:hypothetical protein JCM11017A_39120 [Bacteroides fragilis]
MKSTYYSLHSYFILLFICIKSTNMDNIGKRMYRNLGDDTKAKISQSLRGRCKSASHIQAISQGMSNYWKTIPVKTNDNPSDKTEKEGQ